MTKRKPHAKRVDKNKAEAMDRKNSYDKMKVATNRNQKNIGGVQMDDLSLTHCKYECKYHLVFAPKFHRQIIYGKLKSEIGEILR